MTTKPKKKRTTLRANLDKTDLRDATVAEVLFYALGHGDEDPMVAIIGALRNDLAVAADIAEDTNDPPMRDAIWSVIRRLDAALEMHARFMSGRLRTLSVADEKR